MCKKQNLILASASKIRIDLLKQCGIKIKAVKSFVDEVLLHEQFKKKYDLSEFTEIKLKEYAGRLAFLKADKISSEYPNSLVIGVDQIGWHKNIMLEKPKDKKHLFEMLSVLQGKWHYLYCHISIVKNNKQVWQFGDVVALKMRELLKDELAEYIKIIPFCKECLGGYKFEERGKTLFSAYKGDYFTIMGLPLFPLLNYLNSNSKHDN